MLTEIAMKNTIRIAVPIMAVLLALAGSATANSAAQKSSSLAAPIPPQIGVAKSIFVTNAGWDCAALERIFRGAPDRVYDEFYFALKHWERYKLVGTPDEADLDFAVGFACPPDATEVANGTSLARYNAKVTLTIREAKGNAMLWRIVLPVRPAKPPKFRIGEYRDKDLSDTITTLVREVKALAAVSPASTAQASRSL